VRLRLRRVSVNVRFQHTLSSLSTTSSMYDRFLTVCAIHSACSAAPHFMPTVPILYAAAATDSVRRRWSRASDRRTCVGDPVDTATFSAISKCYFIVWVRSRDNHAGTSLPALTELRATVRYVVSRVDKDKGEIEGCTGHRLWTQAGEAGAGPARRCMHGHGGLLAVWTIKLVYHMGPGGYEMDKNLCNV
jgi:hypothetical protein